MYDVVIEDKTEKWMKRNVFITRLVEEALGKYWLENCPGKIFEKRFSIRRSLYELVVTLDRRGDVVYVNAERKPKKGT